MSCDWDVAEGEAEIVEVLVDGMSVVALGVRAGARLVGVEAAALEMKVDVMAGFCSCEEDSGAAWTITERVRVERKSVSGVILIWRS